MKLLSGRQLLSRQINPNPNITLIFFTMLLADLPFLHFVHITKRRIIQHIWTHDDGMQDPWAITLNARFIHVQYSVDRQNCANIFFTKSYGPRAVLIKKKRKDQTKECPTYLRWISTQQLVAYFFYLNQERTVLCLKNPAQESENSSVKNAVHIFGKIFA